MQEKQTQKVKIIELQELHIEIVLDKLSKTNLSMGKEHVKDNITLLTSLLNIVAFSEETPFPSQKDSISNIVEQKITEATYCLESGKLGVCDIPGIGRAIHVLSRVEEEISDWGIQD